MQAQRQGSEIPSQTRKSVRGKNKHKQTLGEANEENDKRRSVHKHSRGHTYTYTSKINKNLHASKACCSQTRCRIAATLLNISQGKHTITLATQLSEVQAFEGANKSNTVFHKLGRAQRKRAERERERD